MRSPDVRLVPYGPGVHHVGELRRARGRSRGVVVVVHGGFWRARRTLGMTAPAAEALRAKGFDTWNIEYRRTGHGDWADTLADVAGAVDHLSPLADRHGLDLDRVLLLGHSAGGQLAAWCAGRDRHTGDARVPVRGLVTAGATLDLATGAQARIGDGAVSGFLGGMHWQVPDRYAAADPRARAPIGVPTRCVHSVHDERVPYAQSRAYVETAAAAGDDVELIPGSGIHTDAVDVGHTDFGLVAAALDELA